MADTQLDFFGTALPSDYPEGFRYMEDIIAPDIEEALVREIEVLSFREFEFQGFKGKRRVVSFGWKYDFNDRKLLQADDIPDFLLALRNVAATMGNVRPDDLQQALVTEYAPGAGIGWHKDRPVFGKVIGISLLTPCLFRLRRKAGLKWERRSLLAAPRSAYLLSGPVRWEWEHSIPPVENLRYSITYRNFRG